MDLAALALKTGLKSEEGGMLDKLARWFDSDTSGSVSHAVNLSRADRFWTCQPATSLGKLAVLMSERVRRVAICDPDTNQVLGVVSQTSVLRKIAENISILGDHAHSKIGDVFTKLKSDSVLSVGQGVPARTAFEVMLDNNVSGIALVDDDGRLVTNMSASDIRVMAKMNLDSFDVLSLPALEFVGRMRSEASKLGVASAHTSFIASDDTKIDRAIVVDRADTLGTCINLFVASRLHRVYTVDSEGRPDGILSITDILGALTGSIVL